MKCAGCEFVFWEPYWLPDMRGTPHVKPPAGDGMPPTYEPPPRFCICPRCDAPLTPDGEVIKPRGENRDAG